MCDETYKKTLHTNRFSQKFVVSFSLLLGAGQCTLTNSRCKPPSAPFAFIRRSMQSQTPHHEAGFITPMHFLNQVWQTAAENHKLLTFHISPLLSPCLQAGSKQDNIYSHRSILGTAATYTAFRWLVPLSCPFFGLQRGLISWEQLGVQISCTAKEAGCCYSERIEALVYPPWQKTSFVLSSRMRAFGVKVHFFQDASRFFKDRS